MTNKLSVPPYIADPPIYNKLIAADDNTDDTWFDWFNSVARTMGFCIVHDFLRDAVGARTAVPLFKVIAYTTVERNQLENAYQGTIIFNKTTSQFEFQIADTSGGGAKTWVTFTPVAA